MKVPVGITMNHRWPNEGSCSQEPSDVVVGRELGREFLR